jgi:hypothetical protein
MGKISFLNERIFGAAPSVFCNVLSPANADFLPSRYDATDSVKTIKYPKCRRPGWAISIRPYSVT